MIRIMTRFGDKRVKTLQHGGKWITISSLELTPYLVADTLYDAGLNHLEAACALRDKLQPITSE